MKVNYRILISAGFAFSLLSCATTKIEEEVLQNTTSAPTPQVIEEVKTQEDIYAELVRRDVKLSLVSSPAAVNINKSFSKPYVFAVTHADGTAYPDFLIDITYPAEKKSEVIFKTEQFTSDAQGLVTFTPANASFAASELVTARAALLYEDENVKEAVVNTCVSAPYLVRSDISSKGAVLFIWDYNEKGRPVNNSTHVQSEFRSRGITLVGNGPVNETSYIGRNSALYRDTYEIIGGDAYGYLISGTIKFVKPVEADGDEYVCSLIADISGIKMKDGSEIFSKTLTHEARGKNWTVCTTKCKEELAKMIVDALIYGL